MSVGHFFFLFDTPFAGKQVVSFLRSLEMTSFCYRLSGRYENYISINQRMSIQSHPHSLLKLHSGSPAALLFASVACLVRMKKIEYSCYYRPSGRYEYFFR